MLLEDRERAIKQETLEAAGMVEVRLAQIGFTKERLRLAKERLLSVQGQKDVVPDAILTSRKVKLDVLKIEQELLHDVIEYRVAETQLRQAQGLLAVECGYQN